MMQLARLLPDFDATDRMVTDETGMSAAGGGGCHRRLALRHGSVAVARVPEAAVDVEGKAAL
ncbi:hypothetical protein [uncultured Roseobacter sp.]|uniref:hypothetical protein n=1 Tax=uncultured Roseobacter sp. TaxID=114847 RepID=UPI00261C049F|nr:hypothetical protein [uncultured Roseobacter sp.]